MFPLNDKACWFVSKERIGFYDKELQGNLTIPKALFLEVMEGRRSQF